MPSAAAAEAPMPITLSNIASVEQSILSSVSHRNSVLPLLDIFLSFSSEVRLKAAALQSLHRIFAHFAALKQLKFAVQEESEEASASALSHVERWIFSLFSRYAAGLFALALGENAALAVAAVRGIFHWIALEHKQFTSGRESVSLSFEYFLLGDRLFGRFFLLALGSPAMGEALRGEMFDNIIRNCEDLRLVSLKKFTREISRLPSGSSGTALKFLVALSGGSSTGKRFLTEVDLIGEEEKSQGKLKRALSNAWLAFLAVPHPVSVYKEILSLMNSVIFPAVSSPVLLADFLSDSYKLGGVVAILCLDALFTLISVYNLDYPLFYSKLYSLLEPRLFQVRARTRFLNLVAKFLTSNYLPATLVAAFVKRLARVALSAPPSGALFALTVCFNLLRKHSAIRLLIHREGEAKEREIEAGRKLTEFLLNRKRELEKEADKEEGRGDKERSKKKRKLSSPSSVDFSASIAAGVDSFDFGAVEPSMSGASSSSLWELNALMVHYNPSVSQLAQLFAAENAPKRSLDVDQALTQSGERLFSAELARRKNQKLHLAYEKPDKFASSRWTIK